MTDEQALYFMQAVIVEAFYDEPDYLAEVVAQSCWFTEFPQQHALRLAERAQFGVDSRACGPDTDSIGSVASDVSMRS